MRGVRIISPFQIGQQYNHQQRTNRHTRNQVMCWAVLWPRLHVVNLVARITLPAETPCSIYERSCQIYCGFNFSACLQPACTCVFKPMRVFQLQMACYKVSGNYAEAPIPQTSLNSSFGYELVSLLLGKACVISPDARRVYNWACCLLLQRSMWIILKTQ